MAAAGSNNCATGAIAGITGELTADTLYNHTNLSRQNAIEAAKITGALSSAMIVGPDDGNSVFDGAQIGRNAAENNLLMFIHGTNSSPKDADPEFIKALEETFGEKVIQPEWSGKNQKYARTDGANTLLKLVNNYEFGPSEKLNIIDHSHGGNVTKEFTQLYNGDKKIDTLVFLGTPHRDDYNLDFNDLSINANLINVYDRGDWLIQPILGAGLSGSKATQTLNGAINVSIEQTETYQYLDFKTGQIITTNSGIGWLDSHTNLDSSPVWNQYIKPKLKN